MYKPAMICKKSNVAHILTWSLNHLMICDISLGRNMLHLLVLYEVLSHFERKLNNIHQLSGKSCRFKTNLEHEGNINILWKEKSHTYWTTKELKSSKLKLLQYAILTDHIHLNHEPLLAFYFLQPITIMPDRSSTRFPNTDDHGGIYEQIQILKSRRIYNQRDITVPWSNKMTNYRPRKSV